MFCGRGNGPLLTTKLNLKHKSKGVQMGARAASNSCSLQQELKLFCLDHLHSCGHSGSREKHVDS